jgi:hypothetical protein
MPKPLLYTKSKVVKLTEVQYQTLKKLEGYNVRVCDFIKELVFLNYTLYICISKFRKSILRN